MAAEMPSSLTDSDMLTMSACQPSLLALRLMDDER
jgi:regulator of extracellular matrix RemA (YlzA/DUF370 family)